MVPGIIAYAATSSTTDFVRSGAGLSANFRVTGVPEPTTYLFLGLGIACILLKRGREHSTQ